MRRNPGFANLTAGYLFPEIARRRRAFAAAHPDVRLISLGIGDTTEPLTPHIASRLAEYAAGLGTPGGYSGYGDEQGLTALRERIAAVVYGSRVGPDEVFVSDGAKCDIGRLQLLFGRDVEVAVQDPSYPVYVDGSVIIGAAGTYDDGARGGHPGYAGIRYLPCTPENGYFPDLGDLPESGLIYFCSPNNPTGAVFSRQDLEMLAELAKERNLWLLSDEVYREFVYDGGRHTGILNIPGIEDRAIMMDSISKRFSACGARIGCVVCRNREVMQAMLKLGQARLCPPTIEQVGAIAAYRSIDKYIKKMIAEYQRRRDVVCEELAKIDGAVFRKPAGAFYIMPQLPIDDSNRFAEFMLTEFSVDGATTMVAPGDGFYADPAKGKREVRIAYVLKEADLRKAMQILAKGVEAYQRKR